MKYTYKCTLLAGCAIAGLLTAAGRASAAPAGQPDAAKADDAASPDASSLPDVIVTATKRSERELDVAGAIKSFSGDQLLDQGMTSLEDYAQLTPGLQINSAVGSGAPVIRGISTGADAGSLAAIIVDGAQLGSSATFATGAADSLDLDPIDLQRVEVLKGPQGTLYGANTLSGIVSYTLREPDLQKVTAVLRSEVDTTEHGAGSRSIRGAVSVPLVDDKVAVRLSGYSNFRGGFVDNPVRGLNNQNKGTIWGLNGTILAQPTDRLRIKFTGFDQNTDVARDTVIYDFATRQPRDGDLQYGDYLYPTYTNKVRGGIATLDYDLDFAKLTSVTSYQNSHSYNLLNATSGALGATLPVLSSFGGPAVPSPSGVSIVSNSGVKKVSQELRLTSASDGPLQWIGGGYYADEKDSTSSAVGVTSTIGAPVASLSPALAFGVPVTYREYAGFGNLTYKLLEAFDITGGLRVGRIEQTFQQSFSGSDADAFNLLLGGSGVAPTPALTAEVPASKTVINYLATARYHLSRDTMLFARYATGFRPGGPNVAVLGLPPVYSPDTTQNYEAGLKTKFWDNNGTLDITGYYTKWKDIIVSVGAGGISGNGNGGDARVYGVESSLTLSPLAGLSLTASMAYSNAEIDEVDPAGRGTTAVGDVLPNNPRFSGSLLGDYRIPLDGAWQAVFGGTARFSGDRHAALQHGLAPDYVMPSYALFDIHSGLQSDRFGVDLFIRNLTDKRAQLSAYTYYGIAEVTVQRPRTIGLEVTVRY